MPITNDTYLMQNYTPKLKFMKKVELERTTQIYATVLAEH